ncbi:MAG: MarR family winged helix-turn-helix transcriptional regulator [Methanosphaera sp.]|uniref:MarR family winged helix-turn-helix transcriptional regulator n=1 Tax=Methanosphaera sp. TaxID=2666342 RepID=UPI0025D97B2D|nr:MarR family winged helix-turn-helix transcriptional regulator [Methanosphaera sp.]MCI5867618.1 MarR family winged helix-turn-helix transcriptional regulator [Methanosphaera sp.]MDD6534085.1 MarR family winged helix-turn-helix transcriptional regulator [Methanosphaera sp.]MDY3956105.1 MarR family winged helix-turn-helix transcriptional regulator [Methanosphaera sp.]
MKCTENKCLKDECTKNECTRDKDNLSLSFLFSAFLKNKKIYFNKALKEHNITIAQMPVLISLLKFDDYVYQKNLVKSLYIDTTLVTRYLRILENEKLIKRIEDYENRRQNKIKLTDKGRKLATNSYQELLEYENTVIDDVISRDDIMDILISIIENQDKINKGGKD